MPVLSSVEGLTLTWMGLLLFYKSREGFIFQNCFALHLQKGINV